MSVVSILHQFSYIHCAFFFFISFCRASCSCSEICPSWNFSEITFAWYASSSAVSFSRSALSSLSFSASSFANAIAFAVSSA